MFSEQSIRKVCDAASFQRGKIICFNDGVEDFKIYHIDESEYAEARVAGSNGNYYDVSV